MKSIYLTKAECAARLCITVNQMQYLFQKLKGIQKHWKCIGYCTCNRYELREFEQWCQTNANEIRLAQEKRLAKEAQLATDVNYTKSPLERIADSLEHIEPMLATFIEIDDPQKEPQDETKRNSNDE